MSDRPPIPSDLYRRILVEAGHRCAIHTCRYPADVDVHHIVPWEKCRAHSYENLIALCPNCHRRADAGEIDRPSLRLYKSMLVAGASVPAPGPKPIASGDSTATSLYRTLEIAEETIGSFKLQIPQFLATDLEPLNHVELGWANGQLLQFRTVNASHPVLMGGTNVGSWMEGAFGSVEIATSFVSFRYAIHTFYGGAHPNIEFRTVNAARTPLSLLSFWDVFEHSSGYLGRVSKIAIEQLSGQSEGAVDPSDALLQIVAGPKDENFRHFTLGPDGIEIALELSHASGPQFVMIPWDSVRDVLSRSGQALVDTRSPR